MSDTPERIWLGIDERDYMPAFKSEQDAKKHGWNDADGATAFEYVRTDKAQAMVAAALREAAERYMRYADASPKSARIHIRAIADDLLALITPDHQTALDKLQTEARREGMERAAKIAEETETSGTDFPRWKIATRIRAKMGDDT